MGYYKMEVEPKGAKSSDRSGEKMVSVPKADRTTGVPSTTGAKAPKRADSSDTTGERKMPIAGGVGQGMADSIGMRESSHMGKQDGRLGECKGHMGESCVYDHKRVEHVQDGM